MFFLQKFDTVIISWKYVRVNETAASKKHLRKCFFHQSMLPNRVSHSLNLGSLDIAFSSVEKQRL